MKNKRNRRVNKIWIALISLTLATIWFVTHVSPVMATTSDVCGDELIWTLDNEGTLTIKGIGRMTDWASSEDIPWISYRVRSVVVESGVTSIGDYAFFQCTKLTKVDLPSSLTSIGDNAFRSCSALESIIIPDGVMSVGDSAFAYCTKLTSVVLSSSLTSVGDNTFRSCSALENIIIPNGVMSVGNSAFAYCTKLTSVVLSSSLTSVGDNTFRSCSALESIKIPDGVMGVGNSAFAHCTNLSNVILPNSLTSIEDSAFRNCSSLESIIIPNGVLTIGFSAFAWCDRLKSIAIPDCITSMGSTVFYHTEYYNNSMNWENDVLYIGNHLIKANVDITGPYTIKPGTKTIAPEAFAGCSNLTDVIMPSSVISIGGYAFYNCIGMKSITLSEEISYIAPFSFAGCKSLEEIVMPTELANVGAFAFAWCGALKSIMMPSKVVNIGRSAFRNCTLLSVIEYGGSEFGWSNIYIGENNESLEKANKIYAFISPIIVSYSANGGMNAPKPQKVDKNSDVKISESIPRREGFTFAGWSLSENAEFAEYKAQDVFRVKEENITFYAVWERIVYTSSIVSRNVIVVTPVNAERGDCFVVVCYKNREMVFMDRYNYIDETIIPFIPNVEYDVAKVMVWKNNSMIPLSSVEILPK